MVKWDVGEIHEGLFIIVSLWMKFKDNSKESNLFLI